MNRNTKSLVVLVALLAGIQAVPVKRDNPPVETETPMPPAVKSIIQRSCFDCHSNQTVWPWYSRIAPVSWLISRDVSEGRKHLNFSTWNRFSPDKQARRIADIEGQIEENEMPPFYYKPLHQRSTLSDSDREIIRAWCASAKS